MAINILLLLKDNIMIVNIFNLLASYGYNVLLVDEYSLTDDNKTDKSIDVILIKVGMSRNLKYDLFAESNGDYNPAFFVSDVSKSVSVLKWISSTDKLFIYPDDELELLEEISLLQLGFHQEGDNKCF